MRLKDSISNIFKSPASRLFGLILTSAVIVSIFVHLNPDMPSWGLDNSWHFGMNEAVAKGLLIGKQIILTFGPYASVYTREYNPGTDFLMLLGGLTVALGYLILLLMLLKKSSNFLIYFTAIIFANFTTLLDAIFCSYPLLFTTTVVQKNEQENTDRLSEFLIVLAVIPFGLLPLIKVSFLPFCVLSLMFVVIYLLSNKKYFLAICIATFPVIASLLFWNISGYPLQTIKEFFTSTIPIISGYLEAMAMTGDTKMIFVFLIGAIMLIKSAYSVDSKFLKNKLLFWAALGLYLFYGFKAGFVRHNSTYEFHAAGVLMFSSLFLYLAFNQNRFSKIQWATMAIAFVLALPNLHTFRIFSMISSSIVGIKKRLFEKDILKNEFLSALDDLHKKVGIAPLKGTTDIYSFDQSYLLASKNTWNPRPIFQSYSAYTPNLATINEQHIRGQQAPDNIIFAVQDIGRIPSLDDGLSWPAILDNYKVNRVDSNYIYFVKSNNLIDHSQMTLLQQSAIHVGDKVIIPNINKIIFVEIDFKPSLIGHICQFLFKTSELRINVIFGDHQERTYAIVSNMMKTGFIISPLIETNDEFLLLANNRLDKLENKMVKSISIYPLNLPFEWDSEYTIRIKTYDRVLPSPKHEL